MARKLIQAEKPALPDVQSGANSQRFLEDLLEKEISRASRHNHDLALVLFEIETFELLRGKHGESGLSRILRAFRAVIGAKTRRINTPARVRAGEVCAV